MALHSFRTNSKPCFRSSKRISFRYAVGVPSSLYIATQSVLNVSEEMGENQLGPKSKAFLNNLSVKIAHNSAGWPDTCEYLANTIGKDYQFLSGFNANQSAGNMQTAVSGHQQLRHIVSPIEVTRLAAPDAQNPTAEAIVYLGGKPFEITKTEQ